MFVEGMPLFFEGVLKDVMCLWKDCPYFLEGVFEGCAMLCEVLSKFF